MKKIKRSEAHVTGFIDAEMKKTGLIYVFEREPLNDAIAKSLRNNPSKTGGSGGGIPDSTFNFQYNGETWFGIIENKPHKRSMAKLDEHGFISNFKNDGTPNYTNIKGFALNGAYYYAKNAYYDTDYKNYLVIGVCGTDIKDEFIVNIYILTRDTGGEAIKYKTFSNFSFLQNENLENTMNEILKVQLKPEQREKLREKGEISIANALSTLNNKMKDEYNINASNRINIIVAMVLAGIGDREKAILPLKIEDLKGSSEINESDADIILRKIDNLLNVRNLPNKKREQIIISIKNTIKFGEDLNKINDSGETILRSLYREIKENILPFIENKMLDFSGAVYNEITNWLPLDGDEKRDVTLTPRYVVDLMVKLTRVNMNSYVWDFALGSGGFLISAMNEMLKDARNRITNPDEFIKKEKHIKEKQLLGIEKRSDIQMLAILNMFLVGDGSSNILEKDSLTEFDGNYAYPVDGGKFPANVFLLNPPYSAEGNGMCFVKRALSMMRGGWAAVIIQDSAGSSSAAEINREILKNNRLYVSIKMPIDLFIGRSSVQTSIYVFEVGHKHNKDYVVKFIDFRNDGYKRASRSKADKSVNLRDVDRAKERYAELEKLVLYGKDKLSLFSENEYIEDTIDPESGSDWNFEQHHKHTVHATEYDFNKTISDYINWEVNRALNGLLIDLKNFNKLTTTYDRKIVSKCDIRWGEFIIEDLFYVTPTKTYSNLSKDDILKKTGVVPFITNGSTNNAVCGYSDLKPTESGNTITFSDTTKSYITIFYQPDDFIGFSHVQKLTPKEEYIEQFNREVYLFVVTAFRLAVSDLFDFGTKFTPYAKKTKIILPCVVDINGKQKPDFDYMKNYISFLISKRISFLKKIL